jgi:hypothetical protein
MKKKRAWNNSNPLYRYLQKKKSSSSRTITRSASVNSMARKKSYRRKSSSNSSLLVTVGSAMAYGAFRSKLSQLTSQYLPSFAGQYTDEVALGLLGWYASKRGGVIGALGKSALIIESASVGNQLASGMMGSVQVTESFVYK